MSTGIFSIGVSGMQVAQLGLLTTEHNITNASTAGYTRQRTIQASNIPILTGAGAVGQGAHVSTIERMYSEFLTGQVNSSQAAVSELEAYYSEISQIDNLLADPNSGLSPALASFFTGVQQVAANPSSLPSRQSMIASAETLVNRFQSLEGRLSEMAEGVNSQIFSTVDAVNSYAEQIASLNQRIVLAQAASSQPANDLLDQRDQLVSELNKLIKVSTTTNSDGSYSVFIGTGQQLVVGTQVSTMTAMASSADPSRIVVGLQTAGSAQELPEFVISGGQLGGLVSFRSESLDRAFNELGRVAASLALTFNAQHGLGQDLLGQYGDVPGFVADFFDMSSMQPGVIKNAGNRGSATVDAGFLYNYPDSLGEYDLSFDGANYTLTSRQAGGNSWTGSNLNNLASWVDAGGNAFPAATAGLDLSNVILAAGDQAIVYGASAQSNFTTSLTVSDYKVEFGSGGSYTVTRLSDNATVASGTGPGDVVFDGLQVSIGGSGVAGDSFLVQPTRNAARNIAVDASIAADPRLIAAAAPFATGATASNTGTGAISAGSSVFGYTTASLPAAGVALSYSAGPPASLSGFPATSNVSVTLSDGSTAVYSGAGAIPFAAGATYSFDGISFQFSGKPANGDSFTIKPNSAGSADGRNAVLFGKLQTQSTMAGGTASFQAAYAQFVSNVGNKTREIEVKGEAQQSMLEQAQGAREAMSGVNLDEEAANLLRYQQAYQAAAKMLDIGSRLFDTVLSIAS